MSQKENILTPVGRLVQGSLYDPQTTDAEGKPLTIRTGPQAGQPRVDYYFALAIPKNGEKHWAETAWGAKIWAVGHASFPNGQAQGPTFAWKITDGDSQIVNKVGKKPCDREGYPGHWVVNFSSGFAPQIVNEDGSAFILEPNAVNPGDYIQVSGTVAGNGAQQQPGVFINHGYVAFVRYGKKIVVGIDPKNIGFGQGTVIPQGASTTPLSQGFNPAPALALAPAPVAYTPTPLPSQPMAPAPLPALALPTPYPGILNPPVAPQVAAPVRVMTSLAIAAYDQYIAQGWTDQLLVQHGLMQA